MKCKHTKIEKLYLYLWCKNCGAVCMRPSLIGERKKWLLPKNAKYSQEETQE